MHWNAIVAQITRYRQSCLFKCFTVYLFPYCLKILKKSCWKALALNSHIERVMPPLRSSAYTITGSSNTHFVDSPLQTPVSSHYSIWKNCNVLGRIIMWCGKPDVMCETARDLWGQPYWEAMATIKKDQS